MRTRSWFAAAALAAAALLPRTGFADSVTLRWTAPGDDGDVGTAAAYDLRYSETPFVPDSTWWNGASRAGAIAPPAPAGFRESAVVQGLTTGSTYYFVIRTMDESFNVSNFSNVAVRQAGVTATLDPPSSLTASMAGDGVHLAWQAPAANGGAGYRVYRRSPPSTADSLLAQTTAAQTAFVDGAALAGARYEYRVVTYQGADESVPAVLVFDVPTGGSGGEEVLTIQGYPNPAKDRVVFRFTVLSAAEPAPHVRLQIYDLSGHRIASLMDDAMTPGEHTVEWRCTSDTGHSVAPGLYHAILQSPSGRKTFPIAILP